MRMKADGYYDWHSPVQAATNAAMIPLIVQAVAALRLPADDLPITLVDYGSSSGRNSIATLRGAIDAIRAIKENQQIVIIHNDQHTNDFNSLFQNVAKAEAYANTQLVYMLASGTSFYEQVLPRASVHLGISSWSAHLLSELPSIELKDHVACAQATGDSRERLARQADRDWVTFLTRRAIEIVPGGKMVIALPTSMVHPSTGSISSQDLMNQLLQQMVQEGVISKKCYEEFVFPIYFRTKKEILHPFANCSDLSRMFRIDKVEERLVPCPMYRYYAESGDLDWYCRAYASWARGWSEPSLASNVFSSSMEAEAKSVTTDMIHDFYRRIASRVREAPERYRLHPILIFMVLTRV